MDLYSIRNQRISPNYEFPLHCFRSARAWHSLLAERHTEERFWKKKSGFPYVTKSPSFYADFFSATLATIVSYFSAEVTQGI
uniref:Uncharacterized protein n=1 Tax=Lotus japonicus TaxID=34305 RepID=I3T4K3_LOTJA|nr:unknown [Lotus japonicus]